ncbi:MAG: hypothetical protein WBK08_04835 [Nitrospira sp.]|nr:MAG: hypothetical protein E8D42_16710 [Nitrospira sp.]
MHLKRIQIYILGLLFLVSLSACSGSDTTPSPSPTALPVNPAEGLWIGTIPNTNRTMSGLVLDDGVYWILYSVAGDPSILAGLIQGTSNSQNGTFTSSDAKDFNLQTGLLNATITGSYITKQGFTGTISYPQSNVHNTFTTTYDSDYDLTPDRNAVAGTYTGFITTNETATVEVTAAGDISGNTNTGCIFTGKFSPRTRGNVFDVTITFGGQNGCSLGTETVNGIGFYDAGAKQLTSAAFNSGKTDGFVFIGTKS